MPLIIIYNPASGGSRAGRKQALTRELTKCELLAQVVPLDGDAWKLEVRRAVQRGDALVVAAGGDGTINAVVAQLVGSHTALGVLPIGTLNHFAKDAGIPADLPKAVEVLSSGRDQLVDTGEVNGQTFVNNSSIGLYPSLVQRRQQYGQLKKPLATLLAALELLRWRRSLPVSLTIGPEMHTLRTPFIFVGNNDYQIGRSAFIGRNSLNSGTLCAYVIHQTGIWGLLRIAVRTLFGAGQSDRSLDEYGGSEIEARIPRPTVEVAYDGEVRAMQPPIVWRSRPGSLKVRLPR